MPCPILVPMLQRQVLELGIGPGAAETGLSIYIKSDLVLCILAAETGESGLADLFFPVLSAFFLILYVVTLFFFLVDPVGCFGFVRMDHRSFLVLKGERMGKLISIDSIEEPGLSSIERISAIQAAGGMSPSFTNLLALLVLGSEIYVVGCHWKIFSRWAKPAFCL